METSAQSVAQAFSDGSGVAPSQISTLFISASLGVLLVFTIYLLFAKANNSKGKTDEFLVTSAIALISIILMFLITALVTTI